MNQLTSLDLICNLNSETNSKFFEYLFNQEFPWPESTYEDGPPSNVNAEGFNGEDSYSPLYQMGYSVAQNIGLPPGERHHALEKTFLEKQLPKFAMFI